MSVVAMVFTFIAAITLGPLLIIFGFLHLRRRSINKHELQAIWEDIHQIRSEIGDIKEQLADFIIKTN